MKRQIASGAKIAFSILSIGWTSAAFALSESPDIEDPVIIEDPVPEDPEIIVDDYDSYVTLGVPTVGGSGCPSGSGADISFAPAVDLYGNALPGVAIQLSLDQLHVQTDSNRTVDRKSCNVAIPVSVPQGQRLVLRDSLVLGFKSLSRRDEARISHETFFAGSRGQVLQSTLDTDGDADLEPFLLGDGFSEIASRCGEDVILRTNTSATLIKKSHRSRSSVEIKGMTFNVVLESCY